MSRLAHAFRAVLLGGILTSSGGAPLGAQSAAPMSAVPVDAVTAIIDAFQSHPIVALGEGAHGNEQAHAFRVALLRDPRFAATVNDVVVECGTARYQEVMDKFIRGGDVPEATLRRAWEDTTNASPMCERPIYADYFRAVRALNASLPADRQVRVLLGEPPIDWDAIRSVDDVQKWIAERGRHATELIQREVLARKRRALVVYGDMHFRRKDLNENGRVVPATTIAARIESAAQGSVFTIWTNTITELAETYPEAGKWPIPSLARLRGTVLGSKPFSVFAEDAVGFVAAPGQPPPAAAPAPKPSIPMEEQFDAILYLGPRSGITMSRYTVGLCSDAAYMEMRLRRMTLAMGPEQAERFKKLCASRLK